MNEAKFNKYYETLVAEIEAYNKQGKDVSRYDLVRIIVGWGITIDKDIICLIDKLYENELIIE